MAQRDLYKQARKALAKLANSRSPLAPLEALDIARKLREAAEDIEHICAHDARAAGATWSRIGALYGTTKQGAQQRFGKSTEWTDHRQPAPRARPNRRGYQTPKVTGSRISSVRMT